MQIKLIFFFIINLSALGLEAQETGGINDGLNYGFVVITKDKPVGEVQGSSYYNEEYTRGTVHMEDKDPLKVYLRYNVAEERMEMKTHLESSKIFQLPSGSRAEYTLDTQKFVLDKIFIEGKEIFGYFAQLYDGNNFRLLKKPYAKFTEGESAKTGYGNDKPARISIEEEYYIISDSGEVVNVRPKSRDIKKAFGSSKVQDYLKDNKIRSEADLVNFVTYLDKN